MAEKFIQVRTDGTEEEREFAVVSAGVADAGRGVALGATGRLSVTVLPEAIGADTAVAPASENLAAGDLVNFWNDGGAVKVRKADASSYAKRANGFVLEAVTAPANATVYKEGSNTQLSGLIPGAEYFLSNTTPGAVTAAPVTTAGHILQYVGTAVSATTLDFESGRPVIRA